MKSPNNTRLIASATLNICHFRRNSSPWRKKHRYGFDNTFWKARTSLFRPLTTWKNSWRHGWRILVARMASKRGDLLCFDCLECKSWTSQISNDLLLLPRHQANELLKNKSQPCRRDRPIYLSWYEVVGSNSLLSSWLKETSRHKYCWMHHLVAPIRDRPSMIITRE